GSEFAEIRVVHRFIIIELRKIYAALQRIFHRRPGRLETCVDLAQNELRLLLDAADLVRPVAADKYQVAIGNDFGIKRRSRGFRTSEKNSLFPGTGLRGCGWYSHCPQRQKQ